MGRVHRAPLLILLLGCAQTGLAKVFDIYWDVPQNGLIMPSVSTAKCGDVVRFRCPPHATHGVFRLSNVQGVCPQSFDTPSAGVVLSAPTRGCDFNLTLGDEPDFFVTSQVGSACAANMKMNIHSVCPQQTGTSASGVLGISGMNANRGGSWSTGVVPGSRFDQAGNGQSPLAAAQNAYSSSMMMEQDDGLAEAGSVSNTAGRQVLPVFSSVTLIVVVVAAVLF